MKISYRHLFLLVGFVLTNLSFLYFASNQDKYLLLFSCGLLISLISLCFILFKKDTLKNKLLWVALLFVLVTIQRLLEPTIIKHSYAVFLKDHYDVLTMANQIIGSKSNDISIFKDSGIWLLDEFDGSEEKKLRQVLDPNKIVFVYKDADKIFYCTYSMLDVQNGVYYFLNPQKVDSRYRHIFGNWYL
jgi:hypothetical protein